MLKLALVMAALAAAGYSYAKWVRPVLHDLPLFAKLYAEADGFWARIYCWARHQWDIALAAVAIVGPEIPEILTDLGAIDLTEFIPTDTSNGLLKAIGIAFPIVRAVLLRRLAPSAE